MHAPPRPFRRALLVPLVAGLSLGAFDAAQSESGSTDLEAALEDFQSGFDAANRLSGVLCIWKGEEVLLRKAWGSVDAEGKSAIGASTPFGIASITKIVTLAALFDLVHEGRVGIEDPLARWIPDFPGADRITIGHLVNHRAGIPHRVSTRDEERRHSSAADVVARAARFPLAFQPGSQSSYSTAGFGVLARVLEVVDGKPYAQVLAERVFARAAMRDSYDLTAPQGHPAPAAPLLPAHGRLVAAPARDLSYLVGGGSVVSTVEDLGRFVRALRGGRIGQVRMEELAPAGTTRWVGASNGYFGWIEQRPAEDLTIVFLGNSWGGAGPALMDALPALIHGEHPAPPTIPRAAAMPEPAELTPLAGQYRVRPVAAYTVEVREGELLLEDSVLVPIGPDSWWHPAWSRAVHFVRDESGAILALQRDDGARWPRVAEAAGSPQGETRPSDGAR